MEYPQKLDNSKDPTFNFWQRTMHYKILTDIQDMLTDKAKAVYIISRCKGKAAEHLKPALRTGIYNKDPEGLMAFL